MLGRAPVNRRQQSDRVAVALPLVMPAEFAAAQHISRGDTSMNAQGYVCVGDLLVVKNRGK